MNSKTCELCGERNAKYVCQECSRLICERCIEPYSWLCLECYEKIKKTPHLEAEVKSWDYLRSPLMKIFILGFILTFIGMIILILAALFSGLKVSFSIVLLPIPIIFGAGEQAAPLIIITAALAIIIYIVTLILIIKRRLSSHP
jgi:uncharacterized membrane protein